MSSVGQEAPGDDDVYVYPVSVKKEQDAGAWGMATAAAGPGVAPNIATPLEFGSRQFTREEERRIQMELMEDVPQRDIRTRPGPGGQRLHYLAGWKSVEIANRIFGFNGWSEKTMSKRTNFCDQMPNGRWAACVICSVRVTLKDGTYREDTGGGSAENLKSRQDCIMLAEKEAVTDARKRALKNFGRRLGLSLYDDEFLRDLASDTAKKVKALKAANAAKHAASLAVSGKPTTAAYMPGLSSRQGMQMHPLPTAQQRKSVPPSPGGVHTPSASTVAAPPQVSTASGTLVAPVKQTAAEVNKRVAVLHQKQMNEISVPQVETVNQASIPPVPPKNENNVPTTTNTSANAVKPQPQSCPPSISPEDVEKRREARLLKARLMQEQAKKNRAAQKPQVPKKNIFGVVSVAKPDNAPVVALSCVKPAAGMSPVTPVASAGRQGARPGMASPPPGLNSSICMKRPHTTARGPLTRPSNNNEITPQFFAKKAKPSGREASPVANASSFGTSVGSSGTNPSRTREEEDRLLAMYAAGH